VTAPVEALPSIDIDTAFDEIVASLGLTAPDERTRPEHDRITVLLDLPHLRRYGHEPTRELVYGCSFPVKVGDLVSCPPTPLHRAWTTGVVVALTGNGYKGRVKYVRKHRPKGPEKE